MLVMPSPNPKCVLIQCPVAENWRLEGAPAKYWIKADKIWELPILPNVQFMRENLQRGEFLTEAIHAIKTALAPREAVDPGHLDTPGTPMEHQTKALAKAWGLEKFFFDHAMGTGKTYTMLTLAANLYRREGMQALLVVCPASIRRDVWEREVKKWLEPLGIDYVLNVIEPTKHPATARFLNDLSLNNTLRVMVASVQSLSDADGKAYQFCHHLLSQFKAGMVVDESSRIKNNQAKRTQNVINLGSFAAWRWCMTGTKVTQGLQDLYAQFRFLDWTILGHRSFYTFRNKFCVMGGFEGRKIMGYRDVNQMLDLIRPWIDVVRKEDANDLPPKTYQIRTVTASPEQKKCYRELKEYMRTLDGDEELQVSTILDRMCRFQQIAGGNFPYQKAEGEWCTKPLKSNPKLEELLDILDETDEKVLIWARFVPEIQAIIAALKDKYGPDSVVAYYGQVDAKQRTTNIKKFEENDDCRFMVLNQQTGSMGLTLINATLVVYYSNSFSLEDRMQSEDRNHRTGQDKPVTYIDLKCDLPIDTAIVDALAQKKSIATFAADALAEHRKG